MARLKWKEVIAEAIPIIASFVDMGTPPTVRAIHYALVSRNIIPNTLSGYQGVIKNVVKARKDGRIPWDWIADEGRKTRGSDNPLWEADGYVEGYVDHFMRKLGEFKMPMWLNQPYYVEVWIEKNTMANIFLQWLSEYNVVIVPCKGYPSWTFLKDAAGRFTEQLYDETENPLIAAYQGVSTGHVRNDRKAIILYFGDFDPSGKDIDRFLIDSFRFFGIDVKLERYAVMKDHIEKYSLPSTPETAKERAKMMRDPRFKKWEHGFTRVELDAMFGLVPEDFKEIIVDSVENYFDRDIYAETLEEEEKRQERIKEYSKEYIEEKLETLFEE